MTPTQRIIERLAKELGHSDGAIRAWRHDGRVAHSARLPIARRASAEGVVLDDDDFDAVRPTRGGRPRRLLRERVG